MAKSRASVDPSVEHRVVRSESSDRARHGVVLVDPRPEAIAQRRLRDRIEGSTRMAVQGSTPYIGRLPARLSSGIEAMSGLSMNHVKVHYDSPEPARLNALAYARGSEIHLGPGQQRHLPHEAWHVVQQAQGRVGSTGSMAGTRLNDDAGLEREADVMGTRALSNPTVAAPRTNEGRTSESKSSSAPVVQRVTAVGGNVQTNHVLVGAAQMSDEQPVDAANHGERPVIIEVMEGNANVAHAQAAAIAKIDAIHANASAGDNRGIMIALNRRADAPDLNGNRLRAGRNFAGYGPLTAAALAVAQHAEANNVQAGCYPAIWAPTGGGGGYTFPFLEMRAQVTLHPGTTWMLGRMRDADVGDPIMRSMDGDVANDPLLANPISALPLAGQKLLEDIGRVAYEERQVGGQDVVPDLSKRGADIVSGGYNWDTTAKGAAFWNDAGFAARGAAWNNKLQACLDLINDAEHDVRERYAALLPASVYWPEPNAYMDFRARRAGAQVALDAGQAAPDVQQRETTFYVREINNFVGHYDRSLATTKPLKDYFNNLRDMIKDADNRVIPRTEVRALIEAVRQSHMSPEHLQHILQWHDAEAPDDSLASGLEAIRSTIVGRVTTAVTAALR